MFGQGSPLALSFRLLLCGCLWLAASVCGWSCAISEEIELRLRVNWEGEAHAWHGQIRLSHGQIRDLRLLGSQADQRPSQWLDSQQIVVQAGTPRTNDGLEFTVVGSPTDKLLVTLGDELTLSPREIEVPLAELIAQPFSAELDHSAGRLYVMRAPGDQLRVQLQRDSLVFLPNEKWQLQVEPHLLSAGGTTPLRLRAQLELAEEARAVWTHEVEVKGNETGSRAVALEVPLPAAEGVYDLVLTAINPGLSERLHLKGPLAQRKVQLVVLSPQSPELPTVSFEKIYELDPANAHWWERFSPSLLMASGFKRGPIGSGDVARWEHPQFGGLTQLGSHGESHAAWEAYPLLVSDLGQPHELEIEVPSDAVQSLGINLIDLDSTGKLALGASSGLFVTETESANLHTLVKQRLLFWPRSKTPLLVLSNRHPQTRAVFGKIRVLGPSHSALAALNLTRGQTSLQMLPPSPAVASASRRHLALACDEPQLARFWGGSDALDPSGQFAADDWNTFYQAGVRLANYLEHVGYSQMFVPVVTQGGSLYPSDRLQPSARFDTGGRLTTGQDPVRKDVLELILSIFDREQLQCIPTLNFAAALPELETLVREPSDEPSGIEWIGADGPCSTSPGDHRHPRPLYNPLHPRVQQAMRGIVQELLDRYRSHPSFQGIALQLSTAGFASLPLEEGPFDDNTIAAFEQAYQVSVPGAGPGRYLVRAKFLAGNAKEAWLKWRADRMAQFYADLAAEVAQLGPQARLHLDPARLRDEPQLLLALQPTLPNKVDYEQLLLAIGLPPRLFTAESRVVVWRERIEQPLVNLVQQAGSWEMSQSNELDLRLAQDDCRASAVVHPATALPMPTTDGRSKLVMSADTLAAPLGRSGESRRQALAHALARQDSNLLVMAGTEPLLGGEDLLRSWFANYAQLPRERFETLTPANQPVVIRRLTLENETYFYLVNDAHWSTTVSLPIEMPSDAAVNWLSETGTPVPLERDAQGSRLVLPLRPFDLVALRIESAQVHLGTPTVQFDPAIATQLQRRIQDLGTRAASLAVPPPLEGLPNRGFEVPLKGKELPGWSISAGSVDAWKLESQGAHAGTQSLRLNSTGKRTTLRSVSLPLPATGRLSVLVWLRWEGTGPQPSVRLAIAGTDGDEDYYRFAAVGGSEPDAVPIPGSWTPYLFEVSDLPSGLADLHVAFELMNAGQVWIDDVQMCDLTFSEVEQVELTKLMALASAKLRAGQIADCEQILSGYWAHFLADHVTLVQGAGPLAQRPRYGAEAIRELTPTASKKNAVLERLEKVRDWAPRFKK